MVTVTESFGVNRPLISPQRVTVTKLLFKHLSHYYNPGDTEKQSHQVKDQRQGRSTAYKQTHASNHTESIKIKTKKNN